MEVQEAARFADIKSAVASVSFSSADGSLLAAGSADRTVSVFKVGDGRLVRDQVLTGHTHGVSDVSWGPELNMLCSASDDGTVRIWDARTPGGAVTTLSGHSGWVMTARFNPSGSMLASAGKDCIVRLWDVRTSRVVTSLSEHGDPVVALDFNKDGTLLSSGGYDGLAKIWDVSSGNCLKTIVDSAENPPLGTLIFSPNGQYLLIGTLDNTLRLIDHHTGKQLKVYNGHVNKRFCLGANLWTVPGKLVVAGSEDGQVFLWDVNSMTVMAKLSAHSDVVLASAVHPTAPYFATGGSDSDHTLALWKVTAAS